MAAASTTCFTTPSPWYYRTTFQGVRRQLSEGQLRKVDFRLFTEEDFDTLKIPKDARPQPGKTYRGAHSYTIDAPAAGTLMIYTLCVWV